MSMYKCNLLSVGYSSCLLAYGLYGSNSSCSGCQSGLFLRMERLNMGWAWTMMPFF